MDVLIRKASPEDFPTLFALINAFATFQGAAEKVTITVEQMKAESNYFQCFVAESHNQEIVGFATFFPAYYSWTGKALYLDDLYVKEEDRHQGIGNQLLTAVIRHAKAIGCKKVRWQVSKWNANAILFYQRFGATIDEVEINCDYVLS